MPKKQGGKEVTLPEKSEPKKSYSPSEADQKTIEFLDRRVVEMKDYRQQKLRGNSKSIEDIWNEVEREYQPHELNLSMSSGTRIVTDEDNGIRGRLVKIGEEEGWQSNMASPDLYAKVNTAISILIDQNPEAVFMPDGKRYEKNTELAYGNWKHSWEVSGAKQQLKNFVFNMSKYGTGYFRTYPKMLKMLKKIRTEYYPDQPEKDKYAKKTIVKYNDLCRESINPFQVWMSEMTRPGDYNSMDDWYFEVDFSPEKFKQVFADYSPSEFVKEGMNIANEAEADGSEKPKKNITVGFYENQVNDIFGIWVPSAKILLYSSPLPNDDGMLSLTFAPWTLRDDTCPYGIGLWEIIKNDSILYDRLNNMTMDQLTLSIYKMGFFQGTSILGENGQLKIRPGGLEQTSDAKNITFLEVPGPGAESWHGLDFLQRRKDTISGVTPQLYGQSKSATLGQDMQSKEAALERMKTPLDYILDALQQEAYVTLSWQKQLLSTPEILEYTDESHLAAALKEIGMDDQNIQSYLQESKNPQQGTDLVFGSQPDETTGEQRKFANVYKEVPYNMEQDDKGELIESKEQRFYRFGTDLPLKRLDWKGMIRIKPQSVLAPSKELTRRMKLDVFNLFFPALQNALNAPMLIPALMLPMKQILNVYDMEPSDWMDEDFMTQLHEQAMQPAPVASDPPKLSVSIKFETLAPDIQQQMLEKYADIKPPEPPPEEQPLFVDKATLQQGAQPPQGGQSPQSGLKPLVPRGNLVGGQNPGASASTMASNAMQIE